MPTSQQWSWQQQAGRRAGGQTCATTCFESMQPYPAQPGGNHKAQLAPMPACCQGILAFTTCCACCPAWADSAHLRRMRGCGGSRVRRHHKDGGHVGRLRWRWGRELAGGRSWRACLKLEEGGMHERRLRVVICGNSVAVSCRLRHSVCCARCGGQVVVVAVFICCRARTAEGRR